MGECWLCGSTRNREFLPDGQNARLRVEDLKSSDCRYGRTARIVGCLACGFRFADPLPAPALLSYYEACEDPEYAEEEEGRALSFRHVVKECRSLMPEARTLLDVGAGTGLFCRVAREEGLEAWGVEPSEWAVKQARVRDGVTILRGSIPHPGLIGRKFDIVSLMDVLEHVSTPLEILSDAAEALNPGGFLVIVTPDTRSLSARLLGRRWWHYRLAHVGYFDSATLARALRRSGLEPVAWKSHARSFSVGYLLKRLECYLPTGWLRALVARSRRGRILFRRTLVLNLRDSILCYARKPPGKETR
jgi:SAM-dependent methyltransferase